MKMLLAALALAAALSGCADLPAPHSAPERATYVAGGTEPFWSVSIDGDRITFETPDEPVSSRPLITEGAAPGGQRLYGARGITVEVRRGVCSDGMSDRLYADTVTVTRDGAVLHGCGAPLAEPDFFEGRRWAIVSIDGQDVSGADYLLEFAGGRLSGRAGCNRLSGRYTMADVWTLTASDIAATRMACPAPRMAHEQAVLRLLGTPVSIQLGDGLLELHGAGGSVVELRLIGRAGPARMFRNGNIRNRRVVPYVLRAVVWSKLMRKRPRVTMPRWPAWIMLGTAAACVYPAFTSASAAPEEHYEAIGQEPGWRLSIHDARIDYTGDYGAARTTVVRPEPSRTPTAAVTQRRGWSWM